MEQVEKDVEDWIKPYATIIGDKNNVDINLRETKPTKYFVRKTLPNNFESYAIILHSFWINHKVIEDKVAEAKNNNLDLPEEEFTRTNWKEFYELKGTSFELDTTILNSVNWKYPFKQMNNELFPGEGYIDEEHLESLIKNVYELYGSQEIEVFYTFLSTQTWEKDLIFSGKITDLRSLLKKEELILTPSLIYSKQRNWVVNTDYDLSFSTIGGERELIDRLVKENKYEVFKVEY